MGGLFLIIALGFLVVAVVKSMQKETKSELPGPSDPPLIPDPPVPVDDKYISVYCNTEVSSGWTCNNCECENPYSSENCCVCNHHR